MEALLSFWANLGHETWPDKYHPVLYHLIDVAAVARGLWDDVFRPRMRRWLARRLGLDDDEAACARWVAFFAGAHDIGKIAACFQDRNDSRTAQLKQRLKGFEFPGWNHPHGTISAAILADLLQHPAGWPALPSDFAEKIAVAVGGHHGLFPPDWRDVRALLRASRRPCPWDDARRRILETLARLLEVGPPAPQLADPADQSVFMTLAGLTSVADWIGSNQTFFEPKGNADTAAGKYDLDAYYRHAQSQAGLALKELGWLGRGSTAAPVTFAELFAGILAGPPRPLQRAVERIVQEMTGPALVLVEAPMGEGKTEAAWYAADAWDQRGGQGSYVALPTMATSNQMYERVERFLKQNPGVSNLQLLHGKAQMNEHFSERLHLAEIYDEKEKDGKEKSSVVVAEGWFAANKKHGLLAPYGVGTIDQALLAVLQTKHVFVRLFGLAGKCVILDEVHAYDAYMSTLLERLLQWLAVLGCPVVLLSATLPKDKRQKLLEAYALGRGSLDYEDQPYPRVTVLRPEAGCPVHVEHVEPDAARSRTVRLQWKRPEQLATELRAALAGGCAAVIRNTVGLAQQTYLELRQALAGSGIEVELFHARFPFGRRQQIEDRVLKRYGKGPDGKPENPERPMKAVLVATQVIEQSLDLDFDLLVTDVAPVDLVLQRAGRLWRHDRSNRGGVGEPTLWLVEPEQAADGVPDFGPSSFIYDRHILLRTYLVLKACTDEGAAVIEVPKEIDPLVQAIYGEEGPPPGLPVPLRDYWHTTATAHRVSKEKEQAQAEDRQIKKPIYRGDLSRLAATPREEDSPDLHPAHQALTRLTRPTAALICLVDEGNGRFRLPLEAGAVVSLRVRRMSAGGREDLIDLLKGEVSCAHLGLVRELAARPLTPREWKEVGMLSRHHLVVFRGGTATVGRYELHLDDSLGLTIASLDGAAQEDE